jgi:hypothetical protein
MIVKVTLKAEEEKAVKEMVVETKLIPKAKAVFTEIFKQLSTEDGKMTHEHLIRFCSIHFGKLIS